MLVKQLALLFKILGSHSMPRTGECIVEFEDQNFSRDSVYYVRAIQNPTPAINGSPLSQER